jgi:hypothetical protein
LVAVSFYVFRGMWTRLATFICSVFNLFSAFVSSVALACCISIRLVRLFIAFEFSFVVFLSFLFCSCL